MATASKEGGIGGKLRGRRSRTPQTPYDRPPAIARNADRVDAPRNGLLSLVLEPASRIITRSAARLFSSLYRKRLPAPPPPLLTEERQEPEHELPVGLSTVHEENPSSRAYAKAQVEGNGGGKDADNSSDDHGITKLEQLLEQRAFTRVEIDRLTELLHSRTVSLSTDHEIQSIKPSTSLRTAAHGAQEVATSTPEKGLGSISTGNIDLRIPEEQVRSPAEIAKAYMSSRMPEGSPSMLSLRSHLLIGDKSFSDIKQFAHKSSYVPVRESTVSLSGVPRLAKNIYQTPSSHGKSSPFNMTHSPVHGLYSRDTLKVLKRRSISDSGYVSPIRRVRQKLNIVLPQKEKDMNLLAYCVADNKDARTVMAHCTLLPPSGDMTQNIQQQPDNLASSPKERSKFKATMLNGSLTSSKIQMASHRETGKLHDDSHGIKKTSTPVVTTDKEQANSFESKLQTVVTRVATAKEILVSSPGGEPVTTLMYNKVADKNLKASDRSIGERSITTTCCTSFVPSPLLPIPTVQTSSLSNVPVIMKEQNSIPPFRFGSKSGEKGFITGSSTFGLKLGKRLDGEEFPRSNASAAVIASANQVESSSSDKGHRNQEAIDPSLSEKVVAPAVSISTSSKNFVVGSSTSSTLSNSFPMSTASTSASFPMPIFPASASSSSMISSTSAAPSSCSSPSALTIAAATSHSDPVFKFATSSTAVTLNSTLWHSTMFGLETTIIEQESKLASPSRSPMSTALPSTSPSALTSTGSKNVFGFSASVPSNTTNNSLLSDEESQKSASFTNMDGSLFPSIKPCTHSKPAKLSSITPLYSSSVSRLSESSSANFTSSSCGSSTFNATSFTCTSRFGQSLSAPSATAGSLSSDAVVTASLFASGSQPALSVLRASSAMSSMTTGPSFALSAAAGSKSTFSSTVSGLASGASATADASISASSTSAKGFSFGATAATGSKSLFSPLATAFPSGATTAAGSKSSSSPLVTGLSFGSSTTVGSKSSSFPLVTGFSFGSSTTVGSKALSSTLATAFSFGSSISASGSSPETVSSLRAYNLAAGSPGFSSGTPNAAAGSTSASSPLVTEFPSGAGTMAAGSASAASPLAMGLPFGASTTTFGMPSSTMSTGFSFGASTTSSDSAPTSSPTCSFGAPASAASNSPAFSPATGFSFGASTPGNAPTSSPTRLSFGAPAASAAAASNSPAFSPATGFSFGASAPGNAPTSSPARLSLGAPAAAASNSPAFSPATGFSFGASAPGNASTSSPTRLSCGAPAAAAASNSTAFSPATGFSFGASAPGNAPTSSPKRLSFGAPAASAAAASNSPAFSPATGFSFGASAPGNAPTSSPARLSLGAPAAAACNIPAFSPATGFSFGASAPGSALSPTPEAGPAFAAPAASNSSTKPPFGISTAVVGHGSTPSGNDQMTVEDRKQASAPLAPAFNQEANSAPPSSFSFGSPATSSGQPSFQFGSQQHLPTSQNPSPFSVSGGFSLGTGGCNDKSNRRIVRRREKLRKN